MKRKEDKTSDLTAKNRTNVLMPVSKGFIPLKQIFFKNIN